MRIPFPERIPIQYVVTFAALLAVVQQLEGTDILFTLCSFSFIVLAGVAFNLAGGFTRTSGGYIFFYSTLAAIVGWVVKAVLVEPADSHLTVPNLTAMVYLGTMFSMTMAILISKRLTSKEPWLGNMLTEENMEASAIGCAVVGFFVTLVTLIVPHEPGDLLSVVNQVNQWAQLAVVIGVIDEIKRSGGRRSVNIAVLLGGATTFVLTGLVTFGKQGLFLPILCYLVAAGSMRYRFNPRQVLGWGLAVFFILHYLVPYSQYGRTLKSREETLSLESFLYNANASVSALSDLQGIREEYLADYEAERAKGSPAYFNEQQGLFDRFQMLVVDDKLIKISSEGVNPYGLLPLANVFMNMVPHFLWPDKPVLTFGNLYAHEVGMVGDKDFSTGISFSPGSQAFHMAGWLGVFLIAPAVFTVVFWFFDSLCGDTRTSPWGLLSVAVFAHIAPEGMLDGALGSIFHTGVGLVVAALFCAYVMPIVGSLVVGPQKNKKLQAALARQRAVAGVSRPRIS